MTRPPNPIQALLDGAKADLRRLRELLEESPRSVMEKGREEAASWPLPSEELLQVEAWFRGPTEQNLGELHVLVQVILGQVERAIHEIQARRPGAPTLEFLAQLTSGARRSVVQGRAIRLPDTSGGLGKIQESVWQASLAIRTVTFPAADLFQAGQGVDPGLALARLAIWSTAHRLQALTDVIASPGMRSKCGQCGRPLSTADRCLGGSVPLEMGPGDKGNRVYCSTKCRSAATNLKKAAGRFPLPSHLSNEPTHDPAAYERGRRKAKAARRSPEPIPELEG